MRRRSLRGPWRHPDRGGNQVCFQRMNGDFTSLPQNLQNARCLNVDENTWDPQPEGDDCDPPQQQPPPQQQQQPPPQQQQQQPPPQQQQQIFIQIQYGRPGIFDPIIDFENPIHPFLYNTDDEIREHIRAIIQGQIGEFNEGLIFIDIRDPNTNTLRIVYNVEHLHQQNQQQQQQQQQPQQQPQQEMQIRIEYGRPSPLFGVVVDYANPIQIYHYVNMLNVDGNAQNFANVRQGIREIIQEQLGEFNEDEGSIIIDEYDVNTNTLRIVYNVQHLFQQYVADGGDIYDVNWINIYLRL